MTREEIERLEGRELDAAVHQHIFGRRVKRATKMVSINGGEWLPLRRVPADPDTGSEVPHYSTDIDAAWQVVEEMNRRGFVARVEVASAKAERYDPVTGATKLVADGVAWVDVGFGRNEQEVHMHLRRFIDVPVPTAICRAALLARLEADGDA